MALMIENVCQAFHLDVQDETIRKFISFFSTIATNMNNATRKYLY